jgi:hypothetical protein
MIEITPNRFIGKDEIVEFEFSSHGYQLDLNNIFVKLRLKHGGVTEPIRITEKTMNDLKQLKK